MLAERLAGARGGRSGRREDGQPPVATALFSLTEAGAELEPVLNALGAWGIRYMAQPAEDDEFRSHWFAFPASLFLHDREPDGPPIAIELRTTGRPAVIEVIRRRCQDQAGHDAVSRPGAQRQPAAHTRAAVRAPDSGSGP